MKKISTGILSSLSVLMLCISCHKQPNKTPTNNNTTTVDTNANLFTVWDTGFIDSLYSDTHFIQCTIIKKASNSLFSLSVNPYPNIASISVSNALGPVAGVGIYKISPLDSAINFQNANSFIDSVNHVYTVDSAMINVISASGTNVTATYKMWVSDPTQSKTVTGFIICHQATIETE